MRRHDRSMFQELEAKGEFHRDSRLGRIFHPGTTSYRQISATDSVHFAVTSDNRVSVHVDRVSPLLVRAGCRARYSFSRAVVHNATVLAETVCRLVRRERADHRCHLDCEIVWVSDDDLDGCDDPDGCDDHDGHQRPQADVA